MAADDQRQSVKAQMGTSQLATCTNRMVS